MRGDWKLLAAVLILIGLVVWLLVLTMDRDREIEKVNQAIQKLQAVKTPTVINGVNGITPVKGIDYFDGAKGDKGDTVVGPKGDQGGPGASAYDIAVVNGFKGTEKQCLASLKVKGDKGDPAPELVIDCANNLLVKKYNGDSFWQPTNIKCETVHE